MSEHSHKSAIENELAQWERFALNRLEREAQGRPFEVTALPDELAFRGQRRAALRAGSGEREVGVCWRAGGAGLTTKEKL